MAYVWQRWLVRELRAEAKRLGLDIRIIPVEGWENRGRPASTGHFDPQGQHTKHHTASTTSAADPIRTLRTIILGRPDLPGPLAQVTVAFNGDIYVVAAGRANHAGRIGKSGVIGMPLGADGNALALGDEVDTNGTQTLPPDQIQSMALVSRVVTRHKGRTVAWIHRHQDISSTGKWDIGNRTTQQLRDDAQRIDQEADIVATLEQVEQMLDRKLEQKLEPINQQLKGSRERERQLRAGLNKLQRVLDDHKADETAEDEKERARDQRLRAAVAELLTALEEEPPAPEQPQP
jgi:hypothetical protein